MLTYWQDWARSTFKYSTISGDGDNYVLSRCPRRWRVRLFKTLEGRNRAAQRLDDNGCCIRCRKLHSTGVLR
jgi:hypothetical protein